jgi:hypothetical protein
MTVEEVEVTLPHKFVIDDYVFDNTLSLSDFILHFINVLNKKFTTFNEEGKVLSRIGGHRSLGDIYQICKTYFPNASLQEVLDILNNYWNDGKIKTMYCGTIEKRVYFEVEYNHRNDTAESMDAISRYGPRYDNNEYDWKQKDFITQK